MKHFSQADETAYRDIYRQLRQCYAQPWVSTA